MLFVNEKQHLEELCTWTKFLPWTVFKEFPLWMVYIFFFMYSCIFQIFYSEHEFFSQLRKHLWSVVFIILSEKKSMRKNDVKFFPSLLKIWKYTTFWHSSLPTQENKKLSPKNVGAQFLYLISTYQFINSSRRIILLMLGELVIHE